jgi:hypothetical protein
MISIEALFSMIGKLKVDPFTFLPVLSICDVNRIVVSVALGLISLCLHANSNLDAEEDGIRTLSGEWVVNKSVWKRLRSEAREREAERQQRRRERSTEGAAAGLSASGSRSGTGRAGGNGANERGGSGSESGRKTGLVLDTSVAPAKVEGQGRTARGKKEEKVIYYIHGGKSDSIHKSTTVNKS